MTDRHDGAVGTAYQRDPNMAPNSAFEPGSLAHLVVGNRGRLLDARRTPVRVVGLRPELAFFEVEVLDFEDRGARWELPMDSVDRFQFAVGAEVAEATDVLRFAEVVRTFGDVLDIAVDEGRTRDTLTRLTAERNAAVEWFEGWSTWARSDRVIDVGAPAGDQRLFADVAAFMANRGLGQVETAFTRCYGLQSASR